MADAFLEMPETRFLDAGDVRLAYYETGPRVGPPVVFCHGFPETAFSWRRQLRALADAGRWAVAPDQRGYGLSGRPEAVEAYDIERLTGDLLALIDALGAERAVWCGHDWGGAVVWSMAQRHPERTAGVIGLNTPFTPRAPADPIEILRARFGEDMYIVHFQRPGEADAVLNRDPRRTLSFFMRRPPADQPPSAGFQGAGAAAGGQTFALVRMLEAYDPASDRREPVLAPEEFERFVALFAETGFTGGVNWYRNISRNWRLSEGLADRIDAPALMITAERDAVLPPSAAEGMGAYIADLEVRLIPRSGHWTQQEEPEAVNAALLDWLERRVPVR